MSLTLSPPIRIFAFVGILGAVALAAFFFIVARPGVGEESALLAPPKATSTPAVATPKPTQRPAAAPRPRPAQAFQTESGFPLKVDRALRRHRVVVVAVYLPGASVDRIVLGEARAGAIQAGAGYVRVSALNERVARQLVAKTGVLPEPAVLVVRRPGVVLTTLSVTDRDTVAQAVAIARR